MEDVTDTVLRELLLELCSPDHLHVMMTEFVSTDGLMHKKGRERVAHRLRVTESERALLKAKNVRIVAQIWGNRPENYRQVVREITESGIFDGIDINMGCPVPKVVKRGECSGLIGNPELAKKIIQAAKESTHLPVSVKTRLGLKTVSTEEWVGHLLEAQPAALTLHGRTQKQMSEGLVKWEEIEKAVRLRDAAGLDFPVLGNGNVMSVAEAHEKTQRHGLDGIMIGRGIFENPWVFHADQRERSREEKLALLWQHTRLFDRVWGEIKNFRILRRYYSIYTKGFPGAVELRTQLMQTQGIDDVREILAAESDLPISV